MAGTARMLVVVITVILVIRDLVRVSHEPHVIRYVLLLREILDVEAQVNHVLLVLVSVIECDQEVASDLVDTATGDPEYLLNL
jgi:hypothetical protein